MFGWFSLFRRIARGSLLARVLVGPVALAVLLRAVVLVAPLVYKGCNVLVDLVPVDLAVVDASFISLRLVLPSLGALLRPGGRVLALVKPQFEVGRGEVGKGGVVRDDSLREAAADAVEAEAAALGWRAAGRVDSRLPGPRGNLEIFLWLLPQNAEGKGESTSQR